MGLIFPPELIYSFKKNYEINYNACNLLFGYLNFRNLLILLY